jgi:hypothetical protein
LNHPKKSLFVHYYYNALAWENRRHLKKQFIKNYYKIQPIEEHFLVCCTRKNLASPFQTGRSLNVSHGRDVNKKVARISVGSLAAVKTSASCH